MTPLPHEAYLAAIASLDGVGPARMRWLLSKGSPLHIWERIRDSSLRRDGDNCPVGAKTLALWSRASRQIDPARVWDRCTELGIGVVSLGSVGYPTALANDPEPPIVLFHQGDPDSIAATKVAIVGTRRATGYGIRIAERFGAELAEAGLVVVSGLALGIDAAAHRGALGNGDTSRPVDTRVAAVVGAGLGSPCPVRNLTLAKRVAANGVIYSEVPPDTPAAPWRFPVRNRILAGLADAVVVVESAGAGGSMHTVREAMIRDRPVLAVPGPINSRASEGCNQLIRDGAIPCLDSGDVLMALGLDSIARAGESNPLPVGTGVTVHRRDPSEVEAVVLEAVDWRPVSIESLAIRTGLDLRSLAEALTGLESAEWVVRTGGWVERVAQ